MHPYICILVSASLHPFLLHTEVNIWGFCCDVTMLHTYICYIWVKVSKSGTYKPKVAHYSVRRLNRKCRNVFCPSSFIPTLFLFLCYLFLCYPLSWSSYALCIVWEITKLGGKCRRWFLPPMLSVLTLYVTLILRNKEVEYKNVKKF